MLFLRVLLLATSLTLSGLECSFGILQQLCMTPQKHPNALLHISAWLCPLSPLQVTSAVGLCEEQFTISAVQLQAHSGAQRELTACPDTHGFAELLLPLGFLQAGT